MSVYFQHAQTGHSIVAERCECELNGEEAVIRFSLKPAGEGQRADEAYSLSHPLKSVALEDERIMSGLARFMDEHEEEIVRWCLQVVGREKVLSLAISPQLTVHGKVHMSVLSKV